MTTRRAFSVEDHGAAGIFCLGGADRFLDDGLRAFRDERMRQFLSRLNQGDAQKTKASPRFHDKGEAMVCHELIERTDIHQRRRARQSMLLQKFAGQPRWSQISVTSGVLTSTLHPVSCSKVSPWVQAGPRQS